MADVVQENDFTVDLKKVTEDGEFRRALKTALERYRQAGGDLIDNVNIIIVVTDGNGWTAAADAYVDLEALQVDQEELEQGGGEDN